MEKEVFIKLNSNYKQASDKIFELLNKKFRDCKKLIVNILSLHYVHGIFKFGLRIIAL